MATCLLCPESSSHLPRHLSLFYPNNRPNVSLALSVQSSFALLYISWIHQRWLAFGFLRHHPSLLPLHLHFQGVPLGVELRSSEVLNSSLLPCFPFFFFCHSSIKQHYIVIYVIPSLHVHSNWVILCFDSLDVEDLRGVHLSGRRFRFWPFFV